MSLQGMRNLATVFFFHCVADRMLCNAVALRWVINVSEAPRNKCDLTLDIFTVSFINIVMAVIQSMNGTL